MANKRTRIYEVPLKVSASADPAAAVAAKVFLVDAKSGPAAFMHVAEKFVGEPTLPDGKRIAALMGSGTAVEEAKEPEKTGTTGAGTGGAS